MRTQTVVGSVPAGWELTTLGEACKRTGGDVQTGPFGSQLHAADYVPEGIPSIMPQNIGENRVVEDGIARITPADAERLSRYRVKVGDIVYSRRGDVERRALIRAEEDGWLCGTGCLRVRFGERIVSPVYASYYLGHPRVREWIVRHAHGATMANLNTSILSSLPFVIPPESDQKTIAHILGTLDDKIELNRRTNQTLEEIARTLFRSWFVDFDPVRAKAAGRQPEGMDAETAALFPESFVDSEFGEIPEGWEVRSLDQIAHYLNGLALQKFPANGDDWLPAIKIVQLRKGDSVGADRVGAHVPREYVVDDGDVLFSWSGSLEVEIWCGGRGALNQHLFKVTSDHFPKWFYYLWTRHHLPHFREIAAGKATTMGHIQRHHLRDAEVLAPPPTLLRELGAVMIPLFEKKVANRLESRTLAEIRDLLLPKLLSGDLHIPDAAMDDLARTGDEAMEPALAGHRD